LHPPPIGGQNVDWSFLKLNATITTVAGIYQYNLPANFGTFFGEMTYAPFQGWIALKEVNEGIIRDYRQRLQITSKPCYFARVSLPFDGTNGQRWQVWFWPTPAQIYNFTYKYRPTQNELTTANPYPLGGEQHSETILAACLAEAEWRMEDEIGIAGQRFQEALATSKTLDDQNKQQTFGYNGDDSSAPPYRSTYRETFVTVNGGPT
jgi:hypothetical protein